MTACQPLPPAFAPRRLPRAPDVLAPDGSEVRILAPGQCGSMAHFLLAPGHVSRAVVHRSVEELWFVLSGRGRMWRRHGEGEDVVVLRRGVSLAIPVGTAFQFRNDGRVPLAAVAVTMPPWPGADEARFVSGPWEAAL